MPEVNGVWQREDQRGWRRLFRGRVCQTTIGIGVDMVVFCRVSQYIPAFVYITS